MKRYVNAQVDRSTWGPGPWDDEPDKISWTDAETGRPCLIVRNPLLGLLCGYVAVDPGHPFHGRDYDDVDNDVTVHGGLTFSNSCNDDGPPESAVCHVPEPGQPGDVWWFGFDCGHCMDAYPSRLDMGALPGTEYRTVAYVRGQCEHLAAQLAAIE